jgi:hypothetical protein
MTRLSKALMTVQVAALAASGVAPASALTIYLPENATYRYINANTSTVTSVPANWFMPGFDDSTWSSAAGPFANQSSGTIFNFPNSGAPYAPDPQPVFPVSTIWSVNFDPQIRTTFTLPGPTALTLWLAVDNGVGPFPVVPGAPGIWLNGVAATGATNAEGNAFRWEHVFDVPAVYTFAGLNTLALQLEDHGGLTGYALVITGDDANTNPPITTNPPPQQPPTRTPEPETLAMLGIGLLGLAATRRRRTP